MTKTEINPATLAAAIDSATAEPPDFHYAVKHAIEELHSPGHSDPAHERFLQLCTSAGLAFPKAPAHLTDTEILASPATPELMRYFLGALANYAARIDATRTTRKRQEALANAIGLTGERGGSRQELLSESQSMYALSSFGSFLESMRLEHPSASPSDWQLRAFQRTYDAIFDPDTEKGRDNKQVKKNTAQLASLLAEHGYLKHL